MNPRARPRPQVPELPFPAPASGTTETRARPEANAAADAETFPWDHCPNCGGRLVNQKCKYRCTRCHYFMSCSDFD